MSVTETLAFLAIPWILFFVVWTGSIIYESLTRSVKKVENREPMAVLLLTRVFLYVPMILVFAEEGIQVHYPFGLRFLPDSILVLYLGLIISMLGILFSI